MHLTHRVHGRCWTCSSWDMEVRWCAKQAHYTMNDGTHNSCVNFGCAGLRGVIRINTRTEQALWINAVFLFSWIYNISLFEQCWASIPINWTSTLDFPAWVSAPRNKNKILSMYVKQFLSPGDLNYYSHRWYVTRNQGKTILPYWCRSSGVAVD